MSFLIPEAIESDRLFLRTFCESDCKDIHRYYSDPECTKYTIQRVLTQGETWRTVASVIGHWHIRGYGPYALEKRDTGEVIGIAGLWYPQDWPEPEIKWGIVRDYWGQGYASEAARAVRSMAGENLPDLRLISLIFSGNTRSINLALSLGAELEKEIEFRGQSALIYRHRNV